jgi:hypothetical protein
MHFSQKKKKYIYISKHVYNKTDKFYFQILLYEYNRSSNNEQIKEEKLKYKIATLERKISDYGMITYIKTCL